MAQLVKQVSFQIWKVVELKNGRVDHQTKFELEIVILLFCQGLEHCVVYTRKCFFYF